MTRLAELLDNKERTLDEANELVDLLAGFIATQGAAIMQLRELASEQGAALAMVTGIVAPEPKKRPKLVGFDKSSLIKVN